MQKKIKKVFGCNVFHFFKKNLFVLLFSLLVFGCDQKTSKEERLKKIGHNIENKWMEVTIGNTTYRVQKAYVRGAGKDYKGVQTDLYLRAYMPGFRKRSEILNKYGGVSREEGLNDIDFSFGYMPKVNHKPNYQYNNPMAFRLPSFVSIKDVVNKNYRKKEFELEYYGSYGKRHGKDIYIYREKKDPRVLLICDFKSKLNVPGCVGSLTFGNEVRLTIRFRRIYLSSWPSIWKRLNETIYTLKNN